MSYECMYVCIYPCIHPLLFSHEKGGHVAIHENMDGAEHIMLSEVSQTEKDKYYMISHVKSKKSQTHKNREQSGGYQGTGGRGTGQDLFKGTNLQ